MHYVFQTRAILFNASRSCTARPQQTIAGDKLDQSVGILRQCFIILRYSISKGNSFHYGNLDIAILSPISCNIYITKWGKDYEYRNLRQIFKP